MSVCVIVGGTGETGRALIRQIKSKKAFAGIVLIQRRLSNAADNHLSTPDVWMETIVLQDLLAAFTDDEIPIALKESKAYMATSAFCCLGTGEKNQDGSKVTQEDFLRIDHDCVLAFAKFCKLQLPKCEHFGLVSAIWADPNGKDIYYKTKGKVEEGVKALGFLSCDIFRPGQLVCQRRDEWRPLEYLTIKVAPFADFFAPGKYSVSTEALAITMVRAAMTAKPGVNIFENAEICTTAKSQ